jgi:inner membrane protein
MLFVTHLLFASTIYLILAQTLPLTFSIQALLLVLVGSVIPDIDHTRSKVGKRLWLLSYSLQFLFRHRGIVHSLVGLLLFTGLLYGLLELTPQPALQYSLWFGAGYLIHLLSDGLTKSGIHLIPGILSIKGNIQTGGFIEKVFMLVLFCTTLVFTALVFGLL